MSGRDRHSLKGASIHRWRLHRHHVALLYPNRHAVGMSNLGFQTVRRLFNQIPEWLCEMAFLPEHPHDPLRSFESGRPLQDFDLLAFSISFENDYLHVPVMLRAAGLPVFSEKRDETHPLVLAGGVACSLNPEPIADFIDVFLLGEVENALGRWAMLFENLQGRRRSSVLREMAVGIDAVYVPSLYEIAYADDGTIGSRTPVSPDIPEKVRTAVLQDVDASPTTSEFPASQGAFADTFLVEIGRGCPHGCRFCSAGFLYRPPRYRSFPVLMDSIRKGGRQGVRVGLLGTAVSDLPDLLPLCLEARREGIVLSFSSLRVDAITDELAAVLAGQGVKTATLAPEAGSERMRRVINKGITEAQIFQAARTLVRAGIANLKLYFMVGLPTETTDDVEAIVEMVRAIKVVFLEESRIHRKIGTISVSLNAFVPKPVTPFQWAPMDAANVLQQKVRIVRKGLGSIANVNLSVEPVRDSVMQGFLSRANRRAGVLIERAARPGAQWNEVVRQSGIKPDVETTRKRDYSEVLPWDFIDSRVKRTFLWREHLRALSEKRTPPCPSTACSVCGACATVIDRTGHDNGTHHS
ncbi:radical SAM protein [Desulfatirhabdium butyrativorans]|uniref:radical SAM protein n=1 Tax=Desulfatirhabdium butyrativorans TaxID=340467 RepID=UPI000419205F|nr:radical SAM protein [Desulfatirhabdium butyrativorans]